MNATKNRDFGFVGYKTGGVIPKSRAFTSGTMNLARTQIGARR
jgi:hypothetical protein